MSCSLRKLFSVEEEFEDEDFLSAVEDVENHFASALPENAVHLRPVTSRPQEALQAQSSRALPLCPTTPSEDLSLPALGLSLPTPSMPQTIRDPPSMGAASLRPVSTSRSGTGNQRRVPLTGVPQEPARPQSSALHSGLTFESHLQDTGGFEEPEDDFDKALACMELERASMELELGVNCEATPILSAQHQGDTVLAKKARVADLNGSFQKGSMPATHKTGVKPVQDAPPEPVVHCRTPWPRLRPGATGSLPASAAPAVPQQLCWEVCPKETPIPAPQPLQAARGPVQSSPAWLSGKPRFPGPRTPNSSSAVFLRGPLQSRALVSSAASSTGTPKGPHSSLVPQASPQTPIVTNHLVRLVTAANRTPQKPTQPSNRAKTRRFPGPAGLLPHQHSGENLEDIMVSTPQTPTHGALAKFRTEILPSSQGSVEEDFGRGPWLAMKSALRLDERDPTCFLYTYSIVMVLRKAALKQLPRNKVPNMAVMIKSLTRSTMDASVVFKDPTGEMLGTVHRTLLETRQNELKPGSVLLLKQVGVFSPSLRNHYLNVTPNNLVHIYSPDSGDGDFLKPFQPSPKDSGSFPDNPQPDVTIQPAQGLRTAEDSEAEVSPENELPEADDLDGLLSELPEDFFCGPSSWNCLKAGHPP